MHRRFLIGVSIVLVIMGFSMSACRSYRNTVSMPPIALEMPDLSTDDCVISHFAYTVAFNSYTLTPDWVAYELTDRETDGPWTRSGLHFMADPDCHERQADNEDYRESGYSRGHMAPAADMKWDSLAMLESFYFTNCVPQVAGLNNGRWNQLEMKTRALARDYGRVYVVCGPIYQESDTIRIGNNGVAVPSACFKALLVPKEDSFSAIAFVMLNQGEHPKLKECACTVDELERMLNRDFFCNLPDALEETVESSIVWQDWGL